MYSLDHKELYCSFCRLSQHQVQRLIARGGIHICNQCVRQMGNLLNQSSNQDDSSCECSPEAPNPQE